KEVVRLVREMIPVLTAKGGTSRFGAAAARFIPASVIGFAMQKLLTGDNLFTFIMTQAQNTGHNNYKSQADYPRDVLADARRLEVTVPRLEANEPAFR
ncbi:MAG: hypothetical protein ACTH96_11150, partial [Brevibacterium aurantiacum]